MHRMKLLVLAAIAASTAAVLAQAPAGVTVFEGARVIVGDGRAPIENATFVVTGNRITAVGRAADVRVPAGATRVNLAGKTVMPTIIDTHNHLSQTREMLIDDLKRRAYYGVTRGAEHGAGHDDVSFQIREETREGKIPGAARFFTAGRGITGVRSPDARWRRTGCTTVPRRARPCDEEAAKKVDIIKIWVDDRMGTVKKLTPELYTAVIDEAHKNRPPHHRAHLHARGCEGDAARRRRRVRARRARQGRRRRVHGARQAASEPRPRSEHAGPRRADGSQLAAREHARGGVRRS